MCRYKIIGWYNKTLGEVEKTTFALNNVKQKADSALFPLHESF